MLTKSIKRQGKGQRITINGFCPARQTPTTSNSTLSIANNQTAKQLKHQFIASQKKNISHILRAFSPKYSFYVLFGQSLWLRNAERASSTADTVGFGCWRSDHDGLCRSMAKYKSQTCMCCVREKKKNYNQIQIITTSSLYTQRDTV